MNQLDLTNYHESQAFLNIYYPTLSKELTEIVANSYIDPKDKPIINSVRKLKLKDYRKLYNEFLYNLSLDTSSNRRQKIKSLHKKRMVNHNAFEIETRDIDFYKQDFIEGKETGFNYRTYTSTKDIAKNNYAQNYLIHKRFSPTVRGYGKKGLAFDPEKAYAISRQKNDIELSMHHKGKFFKLEVKHINKKHINKNNSKKMIQALIKEFGECVYIERNYAYEYNVFFEKPNDRYVHNMIDKMSKIENISVKLITGKETSIVPLSINYKPIYFTEENNELIEHDWVDFESLCQSVKNRYDGNKLEKVRTVLELSEKIEKSYFKNEVVNYIKEIDPKTGLPKNTLITIKPDCFLDNGQYVNKVTKIQKNVIRISKELVPEYLSKYNISCKTSKFSKKAYLNLTIKIMNHVLGTIIYQNYEFKRNISNKAPFTQDLKRKINSSIMFTLYEDGSLYGKADIKQLQEFIIKKLTFIELNLRHFYNTKTNLGYKTCYVVKDIIKDSKSKDKNLNTLSLHLKNLYNNIKLKLKEYKNRFKLKNHLSTNTNDNTTLTNFIRILLLLNNLSDRSFWKLEFKILLE